jgi:flagellar assembly protein FliH
MALRLQVFEDAPAAGARTVVTDLGAMEEARLASYELGYTAGWDDAVAAQSQDQSRLRAELAHNLQSLAFTYHEARAHVLRAVEPLFDTMLSRILPELARASLVPRILETLRPLAAEAAGMPIRLTIAPAARAAVDAALAAAPALPVEIVEEETLGEGQAFLRLGSGETRLDLDRAVADITAAVRGFFDLNEEDRNGR